MLDRILQALSQWLGRQHVDGAAPAHVGRPGVDLLVAAGQAAIKRADELWALDIFDPRRADDSIPALSSKALITRMIRGKDALWWDWEPKYAGDGSFEWCGSFAAACWSSVKPSLRRTYFASTYRLDRYARYQPVNGERNTGSGRVLVEMDEHTTVRPEMRQGDIITVGPAGSGYGKHICLVDKVKGNVVYTIEGNGNGRGPNGKRQGVVRGYRAIGMQGMKEIGTTWHVRRLIRPSVEDLS